MRYYNNDDRKGRVLVETAGGMALLERSGHFVKEGWSEVPFTIRSADDGTWHVFQHSEGHPNYLRVRVEQPEDEAKRFVEDMRKRRDERSGLDPEECDWWKKQNPELWNQ